VLALGGRTLVMGILNITPDSFSDGGRFAGSEDAIDAGLRMIDDGADLVDVGGESTRPGARPLACDEELRRIMPVVEGLARRASVPISVDTYKAAVADRALDAGASLVNDVSGLRYEPSLAAVVARHGVPIVLMHTRGRSSDMYQHAVYQDLVGEVLDELRESLAFASGAGVPEDMTLVDPGLGFAKEAIHSYEALARLSAFAELGRPVLVGPSRKAFLGRVAGGGPGQRDWATAAAVTAAVLAGAHVVRVHAVAEMAAVVRVADEIRKYGPSA
jgi:dihydropteroate synthase